MFRPLQSPYPTTTPIANFHDGITSEPLEILRWNFVWFFIMRIYLKNMKKLGNPNYPNHPTPLPNTCNRLTFTIFVRFSWNFVWKFFFQGNTCIEQIMWLGTFFRISPLRMVTLASGYPWAVTLASGYPFRRGPLYCPDFLFLSGYVEAIKCRKVKRLGYGRKNWVTAVKVQ